MKTPDEIKKGLWCCENPNGNPTMCEECPYKGTKGSCIGRLYMEARKCIQQLEAKDVEQVHRIAELEQELAAVKRERDAQMVDILIFVGNDNLCSICKHSGENNKAKRQYCKAVSCDDCKIYECACMDCSRHNCYEWRGVCQENTEGDIEK